MSWKKVFLTKKACIFIAVKQRRDNNFNDNSHDKDILKGTMTLQTW